jgi:hypothetical protein
MLDLTNLPSVFWKFEIWFKAKVRYERSQWLIKWFRKEELDERAAIECSQGSRLLYGWAAYPVFPVSYGFRRLLQLVSNFGDRATSPKSRPLQHFRVEPRWWISMRFHRPILSSRVD